MAGPLHTPGPWRIHWIRPAVPMEPYQVIGADGEQVTRWGAFTKPSQKRAAANAHLIAAAPDLYEALERLVANIDRAFPPEEFACDGEGADLRAARAALAKARGEA